MSVEFFDTHAHLGDAQFSADRAEVIDRARAAGVARIVEIADSPAEWDAAIALSRARPFIRASLGVHPYHADQFQEELIGVLSRKVLLPEVVSVGEIGLDYVKAQTPPPLQREVFIRLLSASISWDKPAVVHCRGAYDDLIPIIKEITPAPRSAGGYWGVIHCFSGTPGQAVELASLGWALGADGPITYPKNDPLREAFRAAGAACAVLETDCPYLPPQSWRGKRNEPGKLPEIGARLAQVYGIETEELARVTTENALQLFRLQA